MSLKTAHVKFKDDKYNYSTSVNGSIGDEELSSYFVGKSFNMGGIRYVNREETEIDDMQECIECVIGPFKE